MSLRTDKSSKSMARTKPITIRCGPFTILELKTTPLLFETHALLLQTSFLATWTLWTLYIALAIKIQHGRQDNFQWHSWTAIVSEVLLDFPAAVLAFGIGLGLYSISDEGPRSAYSLLGEISPKVDVLVTCCGESVGVISNTAAAAATQDYPIDQLHVYVLDDGHDGELRSVIERMNHTLTSRGIEHAPITYLSRKLRPGEVSHFKSGNLRFGFKESNGQWGQCTDEYMENDKASEQFVAALDADMIPERDWLRKMVPHLLLDSNMGLVCLPQKYYNIPKTASDALGQQTDFEMYFSVQEELNDRLGAAMNTGSGYVARRSAIESIGGWPLANTGDDYLCSVMLSDRGWGIAFVRDNLQSGIAPTDMKTLLMQRMRWTDSGVEVHQRLGYYLPGFSAIASRMTSGQRAVNMLYILRDFSPLGITLAMVALPLAVWCSRPTDISHESTSSLQLLRRLAIAVWISQKINSWLMYRHIGLARVANFQSQEIWTAPSFSSSVQRQPSDIPIYSAYRNLIALLPKGFSTRTFGVCGATASPLNECSRKHRKPLLVRLRSLDVVCYILYTCYALSPLSALSSMKNNDTLASAFYLQPSIAVKLISLAAKASTPVRYMIWPPDIPEWHDLLEEDENGVKRPKESLEDGKIGAVWLWWLFVWGCEVGALMVLRG